MGRGKLTGLRAAIGAAVVLCATGAFSDDVVTRTWTGNGGDNDWSNAKNWSPEYGNASSNIFLPGKDYTVRLRAGTSPSYYSIVLPEGSGTVRFTGETDDLSLYPKSPSEVKIGAGREIIVDGINLRLNNSEIDFDGTLRLVSGKIVRAGNSATFSFGGESKLIVEGGTLGDTVAEMALTNNATLTVKGGLVQFRRISLWSPDVPGESITRLRQEGGIVVEGYCYAYTFKVYEGAHYDFLSGTLIFGSDHESTSYGLSSNTMSAQGQGEAFPEFLPRVGSTLIIPGRGTTSKRGALYFYDSGDYDVGGTIYATNSTSAEAGNVNFYGTNITLRGGATIYANALNFSRTWIDSYYDLDIFRINLGIGGVRQDREGNESNNGRYQYIRFLDGIVFGAWGGDVPNLEARSDNGAIKRFLCYLEGPVVYDTVDAFASETTRTIHMDSLRLKGMTELKAVGGGTVSLSLADTGPDMRTLEVAEGTTLAFPSNNIVAGIKTMNLKLGANAQLKLNLAAGSYVDASSTAEFGDGAKIVVTELPDPLMEGMFYPVYFAPVGTDPDLSRIEYEGGEWPAGWSLAKTGSSVYLTDGKAPVYVSPDPSKTTPRYWSGGGTDSNYVNSNNWVNGYTKGGGNDACFNGRLNTEVNLDENISIRIFDFGADSGPFTIGGSCYLNLQNPSENLPNGSSLVNEGAYPAVMACKLYKSTSLPLRLITTAQGSIVLTGGFYSTYSYPLEFGGDIRLGGSDRSWTVPSVAVRSIGKTAFSANVSSIRNSRLTVMPGVTLTVTDQTGDVNEFGSGALAIATNATATIGGTELLFTSNNTHYVDGTLTVNCPLVPTGRQVFRGDGTLTLAGGVADAPDGGVRVEGNLTLVPSNWVNNVTLSVKDNVTIAPTGDWILGGDASIDLAHHSTLTLATGGHKLKLSKPLVSEGDLAVTGGGKLEIGVEGMSLGRITCAGGATLTVAESLAEPGRSVDILTVREDDESIAFAPELKVTKRMDEATGRTVYTVKRSVGFVLIMK